MTLADFLMERIAEDEAEQFPYQCPCDLTVDGLHSSSCPEWVFAQCEAKRRVVESMEGGLSMADRVRGASWWGRRRMSRHTVGVSLAADVVLRELAVPYAGHADYQNEWRPEAVTE